MYCMCLLFVSIFNRFKSLSAHREPSTNTTTAATISSSTKTSLVSRNVMPYALIQFGMSACTDVFAVNVGYLMSSLMKVQRGLSSRECKCSAWIGHFNISRVTFFANLPPALHDFFCLCLCVLGRGMGPFALLFSECLGSVTFVLLVYWCSALLFYFNAYGCIQALFVCL